MKQLYMQKYIFNLNIMYYVMCFMTLKNNPVAMINLNAYKTARASLPLDRF